MSNDRPHSSDYIFSGSDPMLDAGRWIDVICPVPAAAIVKGAWRAAVLHGRVSTEGAEGMQVLILAGALFPGPDLVRLVVSLPHIERFSANDVRASELKNLVFFADKRWRAARRAFGAWQLIHLGPPILESLSDNPIIGAC